MHNVDRRALIATAAALPLLSLPMAGCSSMGGFSLVEAIRRLLEVSSQRAFATLLQPGGFYDSQVARIALPGAFARGGGILSALLSTSTVRDRLSRALNGFAEKGAERAAPVVAEAIRGMSVADAVSIIRGGSSAATTALEGQIGTGLINAMFPAVGDALRLANNDLVAQALRAATGYDVASLARDVTDGANRGIWNAIGAEEAAIRANPQATNDPLLIGVFGLAGRSG